MGTYLTFDLGTSAFKVALFDGAGGMVALSRQAYHAADVQAVAPDAVWAALAAGVRDVLAAAGVGGRDVAAIGLASQTNSFLLMDEAGWPLTPIDLWTHEAAGDDAAALQAELGDAAVAAATGTTALSGAQVLAKLRRLRAVEPGLWAKAARVRLLPDTVVETLTGRCVSDGSLWGLTGLYDVRAGDFWPAALAAVGLRREQLPEVLPPGTRVGVTNAEAGRRLGLPAGIPVAVGSLDHLAAAVAAGNVAPGRLSESTGTVQCLVATYPTCPAARARTVAGPHAFERAGYYRLAYSMVSGYSLDRYRERAGLDDAAFEVAVRGAGDVSLGCDGLAAVVPAGGDAAGGLTFVDVESGAARAPASAAQGVRAILEAVARNLAEMLDDLAIEPRPGEVCSLGGGAASAAWLQIKADMLGMTVRTLACPQAACLGAAMYAAAAAGRFADVAAACHAWHKPGATYEPDPGRHAAYAKWRERLRQ
jgi:xylulokinase